LPIFVGKSKTGEATELRRQLRSQVQLGNEKKEKPFRVSGTAFKSATVKDRRYS